MNKEIERKIARHGIVFLDEKRKAHCGCGKMRCLKLPRRMDPHSIFATFRRDGWTIELDQQPLCPDCTAAKGKREKTKPEEQAMSRDPSRDTNNVVPLQQPPPAINTAPPTATSSAALNAGSPPPANNKLFYAVSRMIDHNFDEETHLYHKGWSDEKIAELTGASVEAVVKWREECVGYLAEPPALVELRASMSAFETEVLSQREALDKLQRDGAAKLDEMNARLADFQRQLDKLSRPYHRTGTG